MDKTCKHCGAKTVEYKHNLSTPLINGLFKIYIADKPVNLKELDLTRNQWDNFQKLRYWDLVAKVVDADGKRMAGVWRITKKGRRFIKGERTTRTHVWTYRGTRVRYGKTKITVDKVITGYKKRIQYAEEARTHEQTN